MRIRFPLYVQTLCLLLLQLALLFGMFVVLFDRQFGFGWDAIMHSPIGDQVNSMAWDVSHQLRDRPISEWNGILDDYGKIYGCKFYIFDNRGDEVAGETIKLPESVQTSLIRRLRRQNEIATPDRSPNQSAQRQRGRFLVHTSDPDSFWVGARISLINPEDFRARIGPGGENRADNDEAAEVRSRSGRNGEVSEHGTVPRHGVDSERGTTVRNGDVSERGTVPRNGVVSEHGTAGRSGEVPERGSPGRNGDGGERAGNREFRSVTLVARSQNLWQTRIFMDFGLVSAVVLGILACSILLWWPFAYRIVSSLSRLTSATEKIAQGSFDVSLKTNNIDEIGRLSTAVSVMSDRLQKYVTGQKRFLGDIAHELCSPVSRLQIALELLRNSATPQQERMVNNIAIEVEEMKALVDELLAFTKSELGTTPELTPVLLEPLVRNAISKECSGCEVVCDIPAGLHVMGSTILIERAFANVLRNAVRYAGKDGPIRIKALRSGQDVSVHIRDAGPGAPPEAINQLGQPFFRAEASRNRDTGGVGLGLAIVKTCIESCDGTFALRNIEPSGLEVEFRFKVAQQEPALIPDKIETT